jgi:hypothetical protein
VIERESHRETQTQQHTLLRVCVVLFNVSASPFTAPPAAHFHVVVVVVVLGADCNSAFLLGGGVFWSNVLFITATKTTRRLFDKTEIYALLQK